MHYGKRQEFVKILTPPRNGGRLLIVLRFFLLRRLEAHFLVDLLQALLHILEALEFGKLFLRVGGAAGGAVYQREPVMRGGGERLDFDGLLEVGFGFRRTMHLDESAADAKA